MLERADGELVGGAHMPHGQVVRVQLFGAHRLLLVVQNLSRLAKVGDRHVKLVHDGHELGHGHQVVRAVGKHQRSAPLVLEELHRRRGAKAVLQVGRVQRLAAVHARRRAQLRLEPRASAARARHVLAVEARKARRQLLRADAACGVHSERTERGQRMAGVELNTKNAFELELDDPGLNSTLL